MKILGIDYGRKRIGIAVSDEEETQAFPYFTLENRNKFFVFDNFKVISEKESIGKIVMGLPLNMKGEKEAKAKETEIFAEQLKKYLNLPLEYEDERLTSVMSSKLLRENPQKKARKKGAVDLQSAVLILQGYLDRKKI